MKKFEKNEVVKDPWELICVKLILLTRGALKKGREESRPLVTLLVVCYKLRIRIA